MHTKSLTRGHRTQSRRVSRINEITENYRNHQQLKRTEIIASSCRYMFTGFKVKFYYRQLYAYDFIKEYVENTKKPEVAILFFSMDAELRRVRTRY